MYAGQAWNAGLHYDDASFNPISLWAPRGSTSYELTGRAKGRLEIEGPITLMVAIPVEQLNVQQGLGTTVSEEKIKALMDIDTCEVNKNSRYIGETVRVQVYITTCKGGYIILNEPTLITVKYTGPNPYLNTIVAVQQPPSSAPAFSIEPDLLVPVPGE
jgi:hypothetical protein